MHQPASVRPFQIFHGNLGKDFRAEIHGVGQVIHQRRILGVEVASGDAIAATDAGLLRNAERIDAVFGVLEGNIDRGAVPLRAHELGGALQGLHLGQRVVVGGDGLRLQDLLRVAVALFQQRGVVAEVGGPGGVLEYARLGAQAHVGVDQRGSTQPAAQHDVDIFVDAEIEHGGGRTDVGLGRVGLQLASRRIQGVGVFTGLQFLAALQYAHLFAGARHARSGNAAAITGTDHHHGVMILNLLNGQGNSRHKSPFCRAANLGRSRLSAGSGRLKGGYGQDCPPHGMVFDGAPQSSTINVMPRRHSCQ